MPKTTILLIAEHTPEEGVPYTIEERNDQNKVLSFEQFTAEGQPDQKIENDYDGEGRLLEQTAVLSRRIDSTRSICLFFCR